MASRSFTTALTLYRSETLTLEQAARRSGVPPVRFRAALRTHGIPLQEADREVVGDAIGDGAA
jgi:predicted HTH domain antitoxin